LRIASSSKRPGHAAERLDAGRVVDRVGARAEARLDHDPAEVRDVQAGIRLDLR